jgi:RNA polymerase sigma factor (sigma-70 family)
MSSTHVGAVLRQIRKLASAPKDRDEPDRQLLERFAAHQDEAAFAALLKRHGPMVLRMCQSVLHSLHDAEDAFQATFLVLAQKAGSIHRGESVSSWLYRVAYHLALRAKANAARRKVLEERAVIMPSANPVLDMSLRELQGILFEELENLPEAYRASLVLCGLEEKSLDEAARLLGWTKGALKGRLQRGRQLLRGRLRRRGLDLSAALCATALALNPASGQVSTTLAHTTLRAALKVALRKGAVAGVVSAEVAALVEGASQSMFHSKAKFATLLLAAIGIVTVAFGVLWHRAAAADPAAEQRQAVKPEDKAPAATPGSRSRAETSETIAVRGKVLDPEGKPFVGAKLYLASASPKEKTAPVRATSGEDGHFQFSFARSELDRTFSDNPTGQVIAIAKGYGFDVATVGQLRQGEVTLRLVKDVPINGRSLDQEGKPVAGATVGVANVRIYKGEDLKEELNDIRRGSMGTHLEKGWNGPLPGQPTSITTGADGKFRLTGFGRERIVDLLVEGPGIHYSHIQVMTRESKPIVNPDRFRQQQRIYGATFEYLAAPSRPIRGVVREKETGKLLAGVRIESLAATTHVTYTDKDGRYELLGHAKSKEYHLTAVPPEGQPYFTANARFSDTVGFAPLDGDMKLVRGIPVRGRIMDKETGKPIRKAQVAYFAVYPNPHKRDGIGDSFAITGPDGSYTVALPGPGLLAVTAPNVDYKYMTALVTLKEMKDFYKTWTVPVGMERGYDESFLIIAAGTLSARGLIQENYHALVMIEPSAKTDQLTRDVALQPGRTLKGSVVGPDGKPLAGATVFGLAPHHFQNSTLNSADFTIRGINPRRTRQLLFVHKEKGLGFYRELRGDEKGPLTIKLQPLGSVSGRVVDRDGQPIADLVLNLNRSRLLGPGGTQVRTDKEGRFRAEGLVPGQKYDLSPAHQPRARGGAHNIVVEPGKTKDLGNLTIDTGN